MNQPKKVKTQKAFPRPKHVKKLLSTIKAHILETRDALGRVPDLMWLYRMIQVAEATSLRGGELVA